MPIFTAHCFFRYQPQAIDARLLEALRNAGQELTYSINASLLRLECYLQITRQTLCQGELEAPEGPAKLKGFVGALFSNAFEEGSRSNLFSEATKLRSLFHSLGAANASAAMATMTARGGRGELQSSIEAFERTELDLERVSFWRGWSAPNRVGRLSYYELHGLYEKFGAGFVDRFFGALCDWQRGRIGRMCRVYSFACHLANYIEEINFADPRQVSSVVKSFIVSELTAVYRNGLQIESAVNGVRDFLFFLERHVFGCIWAEPMPRIPLPTTKTILGSKTNVRKTSQGHEVKYSLVTEIPLHVTDSEAMERLFAAIRKDVDVLLKWARAEVEDARLRVQRRKALAPSGIVSRTGTPSAPSEDLPYRLSRDCPESFSHAAATYESLGFSHLEQGVRATNIYPASLPEITWQLGVPTPKLLLAHATLLVAAHPAITSSFLETLDLFDKDGKVVGVIENDSGHYLVGEKRRRGAENAAQEIRLNVETTQIVHDVIELTAPLRAHLRAVGNDAWRTLFLCVESLGWSPRPWRPSQAANDNVEWHAYRLETLLGCDAALAKSLARRFTLTRLRCSAGVLVYLETHSVQRMAEALGHRRWKPSLLDHYLPRPIQEFFVQRWIRLFQTSIICEVLKNSPLLLRASRFETMELLDEFLRMHALRRMPAHLENPDFLPETQAFDHDDCIVIGVESGILTLLISLELAVDAATRLPGIRALRWARICKHLLSHLETQQEQPEFHDMVRIARQHADPSRMSALIYE